MKILADANIESAIVEWLRAEGHDVVWAVDLPPSFPDTELLALASSEQRIILTHDRDFGDLVFRRNLAAQGVALLRFEAALQSERLALFQGHWTKVREKVAGRFVVLSHRGIRVRPMLT